jgi:hypothetical protein
MGDTVKGGAKILAFLEQGMSTRRLKLSLPQQYSSDHSSRSAAIQACRIEWPEKQEFPTRLRAPEREVSQAELG